ncbi:hypothetical protein DPMN_032854 [Dreissena polymorpha]|uniref:Uncharacterized protein n=1 Tax=Dreissena polymorpha TaxID=45954 RepID=A0A9D4RIN2_DREPO|nr:hypothetical protein DPMN_032854 [Dreissena polymorpha]
MFGNPVQGNIIDPVGSSVSTLVVGALPATQKGTLDGVEYYAVATGTLTLHCGVNHFCSDINTCCNSVPTTDMPSSSCTTEPQQHQLKAVVVQKSKIYYPMSFTTNGNVTLTVL